MRHALGLELKGGSEAQESLLVGAVAPPESLMLMENTARLQKFWMQ